MHHLKVTLNNQRASETGSSCFCQVSDEENTINTQGEILFFHGSASATDVLPLLFASDPNLSLNVWNMK